MLRRRDSVASDSRCPNSPLIDFNGEILICGWPRSAGEGHIICWANAGQRRTAPNPSSWQELPQKKKTSTGTVARGNHCSINSSLTGEDAILVMYVQSGSLSLFSALFVSHNEKQWTSDAPINNYWLITKCQGHGSTWNKLVGWIYSSKINLKIKHSPTLVCYAFMMWHDV